MDLQGWANGAWADGSWLESAWGEGGEPVAPPEVPTVTGAGRRRRRPKLAVQIDGELIQVDSVEELFRLLRSLKRELKPVAIEKAKDIVLSGKVIREARKEAKTQVSVVSAPTRAIAAIEDRINEMDRYYWSLINKAVKDLQDDDEEVWMMI